MIRLILLCLLLPFASNAQQSGVPRRIYFNPYTDSIKTILNFYVNVEGEFSKGKYLPLDTSQIVITSDLGTMSGNEWIAPSHINFEKVRFHAQWKNDASIQADTVIWLKRCIDPRDMMQGEDMPLPVEPKEIRRRRRR